MSLPALEPNKEVKKAIFHWLASSEIYAMPRRELIDYLKKYNNFIINDRQLRRYIQWLRENDEQGALMVSAPSGGYFLASSPEEFEQYISRELNRITSLGKRIRRQTKLAKMTLSPVTKRQLEMFEEVVNE